MTITPHARPFASDAASLAIVGGGPKALMALAALDDALAERAAVATVVVDLYEPGVSGAGRVWDPRQPRHLLLNLDAGQVDFTCASVPFSYTAWDRAHRAGSEWGDAFPPRARMGEYLTWAMSCLEDSPRLQVRRHSCVVEAVTQSADGWVVRTRETSRSYSSVLLATGHAGTTGPDHHALAHDLTKYPPGGHVTVQGAALTGIDVVLSLTAGRGGSWTQQTESRSLGYEAAGGEPSRITLVSRSGELLVPKPLRSCASMRTAVTALTSGWGDGCDPDDTWWEVLVSAAAAAAADAGIRVEEASLFDVLDSGRGLDDPMARWRSDLARAEGETDADPAWWLGRAWALGYADVVRSLERAPRRRETWTRWRTRAARLERWAFGPPVDNVRRMLALADAEILTVEAAAPSDAVVIDAVTTPAGVLDSQGGWREGMRPLDPLWGALLAAGHVHVRPGERGILTEPDATCLRVDGTASTGLAATGRPTEDPVIGHDTLSRTLHGDIRRWATAMADARSATPENTHPAESTKEMAR